MAHPLLYEINTRTWLRRLSQANRRPITLGQVPDAEFESWERLGFTHIWLMGVWSGGPRARNQALTHPDLCRAYTEALGQWSEQDVGPSPYSIAEYSIAATLGGETGLKEFRNKARSFGLKLILDFVPNHLGLDHPWVKERPEIFVQGPECKGLTFAQDTEEGRKYLAYGKDPNWAPWTDTVQVDYRRTDARGAMTSLLQRIAEQCDGVRCDMAMLVLNDVFASTWKQFPTTAPGPATEFWTEAIQATRQLHPGFLFLAEVYWGLEVRLQELGFNYTYDKVLYDRLVLRQSNLVQAHLLGISQQIPASAHFLENHDEPRIASLLSLPEHRTSALVILGLSGMRFLYEGQLRGARKRLPVQLLREAIEPEDAQIRSMYEQLFAGMRMSCVGRGEAELLVPRDAWAGNPTTGNFVLVQWRAEASSYDLVAVNLAPHPSQCYAPLTLPPLSANSWTVNDLIGDQSFVREDEELRRKGLYLDLPGHGAQILHFVPVKTSR